jgi:hypothetical protein
VAKRSDGAFRAACTLTLAIVAAWPLTGTARGSVPPPDTPDPALAYTVRDSEGDTEAVLGFDAASAAFFAPVTAAELLIRQGGVAVFADQPAAVLGTSHFSPHPGIDATDVDGDADVDVIVDTYSRVRAHGYCCFTSLIYIRHGNSYQQLTHEWLEAGYELRQDRGPLFRSNDAAFAREFARYQESAFPAPASVQLWRVRGDALVDVTRAERARVAADMRLKRYGYRNAVRRIARGERFSARGYLAGYVADLHLLGRADRASAVIDAAVRSGVLAERGRPSVKRYLQHLRQALAAHGYASRAR